MEQRTLTNAFRLFVSSTFSDFSEERELLQTRIFPAVDAYCSSRGFQFFPIDLRWGVIEEAQLDQQTSEICLEEVRVAKTYPPPNLLIMIGDRHGWIPLPFAIARDEFDAIISVLKRRCRWLAVRALRKAYGHDENYLMKAGIIGNRSDADALISAYTLRSRYRELHKLRSARAWNKFESNVRKWLQLAADDLLRRNFLTAESHQRYFQSLTEREIEAGLSSADDGGTSDASHNSEHKHAILVIREFANDINGDNRLRVIGGQDRDRQSDLKQRLRALVPQECIIRLENPSHGAAKSSDRYRVEFTERLLQMLKQRVDQHIDDVKALESAAGHSLMTEKQEHSLFAAERLKSFVGRDAYRATLRQYLEGDASWPLVICGRSGFGKSALVASAIAAEEALNSRQVIYRFVGASSASSDPRLMLLSVVEELETMGAVQAPDSFDQDVNKFCSQIRALLQSVTVPVAIFLDGLDQLHKPFRMGWFPERLPEGMKLIATVLDDPEYEVDSAICRAMRKRLPPEALLQISPLSTDEAAAVIPLHEKRARRRLRQDQKDYILRCFENAGRSPLYLTVALEIANSWKSADQVGVYGKHLAEDTAGLIRQFVDELTQVHHHPRALVVKTFGYLSASKNGLSEKEITSVLSRDYDVMQSVASDKYGAHTHVLPAVVWARLRRRLATFLTTRRVDDQHVLQFFHRQVAAIAQKEFYEGAKQGRARLHSVLAEYFTEASSATEDSTPAAAHSKRALSELPYQLFHAGNKNDLDQLLRSPNWLLAKLVAFNIQEIVLDLQDFGVEAIHAQLEQTLRLSAGIIGRDKRQLLAQLICRLSASTHLEVVEFVASVRRLLKMPALLTTVSALSFHSGEQWRLEGHDAVITALSVTDDGIIVSGDLSGALLLWDIGRRELIDTFHFPDAAVTHVLACANSRVVSIYQNQLNIWDNKLRIIDLNSHVEIKTINLSAPALLIASKGHESVVVLTQDGFATTYSLVEGEELDSVSFRMMKEKDGCWFSSCRLPDGRFVVFSQALLPARSCLTVWDEEFRSKRVVEAVGLPSRSSMLIGISNEEVAYSCTEDDTIRILDLTSGQVTQALEGAELGARCLWFKDNVLYSAGHDHTIRMWNLGSMSALAQRRVIEVNAFCDCGGGMFATGSTDRIIRLWTYSAAGLDEWPWHSREVTSLSVDHSGAIVSGSYDRSIRVWSAENLRQIRQLRGHKYRVTSVLPFMTNRQISTSTDGTIRIWDLEQGEEICAIETQYSLLAACLIDESIVVVGGKEGIHSKGMPIERKWSITAWDLRSRQLLFELLGDAGPIEALCALPGGLIASCSVSKKISDFSIHIWDISAKKLLRKLSGHEHFVSALCAIDNSCLASASFDKTIRIWAVHDGAPIRVLKGHARAVLALAVLDRDHLVSGSSDNTLRVWHRSSGIEVAKLEFDAAITAIKVIPGGTIVAGDNFGGMHMLRFITVSEGPCLEEMVPGVVSDKPVL